MKEITCGERDVRRWAGFCAQRHPLAPRLCAGHKLIILNSSNTVNPSQFSFQYGRYTILLVKRVVLSAYQPRRQPATCLVAVVSTRISYDHLQYPCLARLQRDPPLTCFQIRSYGPPSTGSMPLLPAANLCLMRLNPSMTCCISNFRTPTM